MEENNNNENKVNQIVKNEAKKVGASILKKIIPTILPAIGVFFLILLAIGVINLIPWLIQNMFASIVNLFNPAEPTTASTNQVESVVYIDEDGKYNLKVEDFSEQILKKLEENGIDVEATGFVTENFEDMLDQYIKAEVQTTFPKTGISEFDGIITIKRASTKTGKKDEKLKYVSAKEFDKMLAKGDSDIFNCFSINPENFELWIAKSKDNTVYYDANGNSYKVEGGGIDKQEIDYQTLIQNYSVPLNFFIALHVISQDEEFMEGVLEKVLGKDAEEPIVLTYVDTQQINTVSYDYSGTISGGTTDTDNQGSVDKTENINNNNVREYIDDASEYTKKVTTTYSGELYITKADTWLKSSNIVVSEMQLGKISENIETNEKSYTIKQDDGEDGSTKKTINLTETVTTKFERKMYTVVDGEGEIKVDEFVDLIRLYPKVENNLTTSPSNVFFLLQQTENTQKLEKIMRYVIYKLNDVDYGVLEKDLKYLLADEDSFISVSNILREYIRYWEHSSPPPTNADGTCYIIETDGVGHPTVGYGIDIFNGGYEFLFIENGYPTHVGGEVPIEFVDSLEERTISEKVAEIKAYTSGLELESYQINALVSRAYNCGTYGAVGMERSGADFSTSYSAYWNQESDSKHDDKDSNADLSHPLYTKYMSKPTTSEGRELAGLKRRRESEWVLFQCGYYRELYQWHTSGLDIVEKADEIHKYMEEYEYTYCVYDCNGGEECDEYGKPHGLNVTFEESKTDHHNTCCATYVSWVLQELGFMTREQHTNGAGGISNVLLENGWIKIINPAEFEPGDVLVYYGDGGGIGHVDIYAGDGTKYNAGSGLVIRGASPQTFNVNSVSYALRAP